MHVRCYLHVLESNMQIVYHFSKSPKVRVTSPLPSLYHYVVVECEQLKFCYFNLKINKKYWKQLKTFFFKTKTYHPTLGIHHDAVIQRSIRRSKCVACCSLAYDRLYHQVLTLRWCTTTMRTTSIRRPPSKMKFFCISLLESRKF